MTESSEWPVVPLGDLALRHYKQAIAIGPFGSRMKTDVYVDSGVRVIRGQNITNHGKIGGAFVYVTEEFAAELGGARLRESDIVFPHRGAIGRAGIVPSGGFVMSTSLMRIRLDEELADPRFVHAYFASEDGKAEILRFASTVGTPGIGQPLASLRQFRLPLPPLDEQRRIAEVLGALDDLIDTNETLVTRLRALQAAAVLQLSQVSTRAVSLGTIAAVHREKAIGDPETPYLGLEHFAEGGRGISAIGRLGDVGGGQQSFRKGDLLYGRLRPYFQKVDRVGFDGACTGEIWVVKPTGEIPLTWLTGIMTSSEFTDFAMAGSEGTKMPRAKWDHVARYQVPVPSSDELGRLDSLLGGIWEQVWALQKENEQLRRTRDELLPLLMSGAVRVRPEGVAA